MNDIFQSARSACHFEVKSRSGHFPAAFPTSVFWGEKTAAGFGAAVVGVVVGRGFCWASCVFSSRFRALIMAKQQPLASAPASTATQRCRRAVIKTPARDGHMLRPKPPRVQARQKAKLKRWSRFSPKNSLGKGGVGGGKHSAEGLEHSPRRKMSTHSNRSFAGQWPMGAATT